MSAFRQSLALLALALAGLGCSSLPPSVIPRKILFSEYDKARPRISPDGKRLAFLARDRNRTFVWIKSVDRDDARKIPLDFRVDQSGVWTYAWQGDSRHLLYFSDHRGDERFHIRQLDIETGDAVDITPFMGAKCDLVAMEPSKPDELLVEANARDRRYFDLYRVNLMTGKVQLVAANPGDVTRWVADKNLNLAAAIYKPPQKSGAKIRLFGSASGEAEEPKDWPHGMWIAHFFGLSADGKRIWFSSDWNSDTLRLLEWDLTQGDVSVLAEDRAFDVEGALISADGMRLDAAVFNREKGEWQAISPWMREQLTYLESRLGKEFYIASRDSGDERWIIRRSVDTSPGRHFQYQTREKKLEPFFDEYPQIPLEKLRPMQPVHFQARDGMLLYGYLTEPAAAGSPPPMVIKVHGGPWARDSWGYDSEVQWLATRGYAVLQVNYRGSTGFGNAYEVKGKREWGRKMLYDLLDAEKWAISNHYAAPGKVAIMGASYGGYAALAALTMSPDSFACGVAVNGPTDLESFLETAPAFWKMSEHFLHTNIGNPSTDHELLKERSPLNHVADLKAPLLVVQSANDSRVNRAQSDELVKKLREIGKPVRYLLLPEGGHTLQSPRYLSYLAAVEDFLGRCLGGYIESPLWFERWSDLEQ